MTWFWFQNSWKSLFGSICGCWHKRGLRQLQLLISWLFQARKSPKLEKFKTKPRWLDFILKTYPNSFWFISHQYDLKKFRSNFHDFWHESLPKLKTNSRWLCFVPKPFAQHLLSFCYCFPSTRPKSVLSKFHYF